MLLLARCAENTAINDKPVTAGIKMRVHFIDVGQGDSIFIESPNGHNMLIDLGVKGGCLFTSTRCTKAGCCSSDTS